MAVIQNLNKMLEEMAKKAGVSVKDLGSLIEQIAHLNAVTRTYSLTEREMAAAKKAAEEASKLNNKTVEENTKLIRENMREHKRHLAEIRKIENADSEENKRAHEEATLMHRDGHDKVKRGVEAAIGAAVLIGGVYRQMHLKMADEIRTMSRGTMLGANSGVQGQAARQSVVESALKVKIAAGMPAEDAEALAVNTKNTFSAVGIDATADAMDNFNEKVALSAKLAGVSGKEISEFNDSMMKTAKLAPQAMAEVDSMLTDAGKKFGITGSAAIRVVSEHMDQLMNVDAKDREKFINGLLTGAGLIHQSGVDFGKYASGLNKKEGTDAMKAAAIIASATGKSMAYVQERMATSKLDTDAGRAASKELISLKSETVKLAGVDVKSDMERQSKFNSGQGTQSEREGWITEHNLNEAKAKKLLGEFNVESLNDQERAQRLANEDKTPNTKVDKTDIKTLREGYNGVDGVGGLRTTEDIGHSEAAKMTPKTDAGEEWMRSMSGHVAALNEVTSAFGGLSGIITKVVDALLIFRTTMLVCGVSQAAQQAVFGRAAGATWAALRAGASMTSSVAGELIASAGVDAAALGAGLLGIGIGVAGVAGGALGYGLGKIPIRSKNNEKRNVSDLFAWHQKADAGTSTLEDTADAIAARKAKLKLIQSQTDTPDTKNNEKRNVPDLSAWHQKAEVRSSALEDTADAARKAELKLVQSQTNTPDTTAVEQKRKNEEDVKVAFDASAAADAHAELFTKMLKAQQTMVSLLDDLTSARLTV